MKRILKTSIKDFYNSKQKINTLIIGGGNGAHVLASILGSSKKQKHITTNLLTIHSDESKKINQTIKGKFFDGSSDQIGKLNIITNKASEVVPFADVIIMCVPANFQEMYLREISPYVKNKFFLGSLPGAAFFSVMARKILEKENEGNHVNKEIKENIRNGDITIFAGNTLPWACRLKEFGKEVDILATKEELEIGCVPEKKGDEVRRTLQFMIGQEKYGKKNKENGIEKSYPVFEKSNILGMTIMNINGLIHPTILAGNLRFLPPDQVVNNDNYLYYEGVDEYTEKLLHKVWEDLYKIKHFFSQNYPEQDLSQIKDLHDIIVESYDHTIQNKRTLATCFNTNLPYKGLKYPLKKKKRIKSLNKNNNNIDKSLKDEFIPDYNHRYFQEDLPTGLIPIKSVAQLIGVEVKNIDKVIYWCQEWMGKEYVVGGLLNGRDVKDTRAVGNLGINSVEDLMEYFK